MQTHAAPGRTACRSPFLLLGAAALAALIPPCGARAQQDAEESPRRSAAAGPTFLGTSSCSSSLCHGGAGEKRGQLTTWKRLDPHAKSFATLGTERSARVVQTLGLGSDARAAVRCTECHAPMAAVPASRLAVGVKAEDGISCESCHGPASNWVRSHTRPDFSHAQNVQTGVRELTDLYARAGACIACHQTIGADVMAAGHPPLLFELDSQTVAEPPHWTEKRGAWLGPQAWLVGQAAALREVSWTLSRSAGAGATPEIREDWRALGWLLRRSADAVSDGLPVAGLPGVDANAGAAADEDYRRAREAGDALARAASRQGAWTRAMTRRCLTALAGAHGEFSAAKGGPILGQQSRARRLALALARLAAPMQTQAPVQGDAAVTAWARVHAELESLFAAVDATVEFNPDVFADRLARVEIAVGAAGGD